jgi:hypothetical protein
MSIANAECCLCCTPALCCAQGLLSMANAGPDTNTSHFSILMAAAPHLDGHYTIFGEIVEGFEVAQAINRLAKGKPDNQAGADEQVGGSESSQTQWQNVGCCAELLNNRIMAAQHSIPWCPCACHPEHAWLGLLLCGMYTRQLQLRCNPVLLPPSGSHYKQWAAGRAKEDPHHSLVSGDHPTSEQRSSNPS